MTLRDVLTVILLAASMVLTVRTFAQDTIVTMSAEQAQRIVLRFQELSALIEEKDAAIRKLTAKAAARGCT